MGFLDQWDHAFLVNQLGVGLGFDKKQLQKITAEEIGAAMKKVASMPEFAAKAAEVGKNVSGEDGVTFVANYVAQFWCEHVENGKWEAWVESRIKSKTVR